MNNKIRFAILGVVMLGFAFSNKAETTLNRQDMFNYVEGHPQEANNPVERAEAEQNCPNAGLVCAINTENENDVIFWQGSTSKF